MFPSTAPNVGAPSSYFTITGTKFEAKQSVSLAINGTELGTVQADQDGGLMFLQTTSNASLGAYSVIATSNSRLTTATIAAPFMLDTEAPVRPQEGKGEMFDVPAGCVTTMPDWCCVAGAV
jgi:hypothetical protein